LQLTLRVEGNVLSAQLEVENLAARDSLLGNYQVLKDRLAEQGMQLAGFEVQVASEGMGDGASPGFGRGNLDARGERDRSRSYDDSERHRRGEKESVLAPDLQKLWIRKNGILDIHV
jgi:flagellar hook-length control protein FliK